MKDVNGQLLYFITISNPSTNQNVMSDVNRAVTASHKNVGIMDSYRLIEGHSECFYETVST